MTASATGNANNFKAEIQVAGVGALV